MDSLKILERLVAFPTVSSASNLALITYARDLLAEVGIASEIVPDPTGTKASLLATIGPGDRGGVLLAGHTDVVPVEGQDWTTPPFVLTRRGSRLHGRGTADMKGFVAAALNAARNAAGRPLATPLHLALTHDEEIGCVGVHHLVDHIAAGPVRPAACIVGEPTNMEVAIGHKGKAAFRATCIGREAHSSMAPQAVNAIYLACDLVHAIRRVQRGLETGGARDDDYDVPFTTLHVGRIAGGVALNIVPRLARLDFEIRNLPADPEPEILARLEAEAAEILSEARRQAPEAGLEIERTGGYPGLETPADAPLVKLVQALAGGTGTRKVAFGTEGGVYARRLDVPTVICGPGSMDQGHRPDEFVTIEQMARCDAMLARLTDRLAAGLLL